MASASAFSLIGSRGVAGVDIFVLLSMLAGGVVAAVYAAMTALVVLAVHSARRSYTSRNAPAVVCAEG